MRLRVWLATGLAIGVIGYVSVTWALTPARCPQIFPAEIEVVSGSGLEGYVPEGQRACLDLIEDGFVIFPCDAELHHASSWVPER